MIEALYRFLRNLGFTDPLHPSIVHVPIGLVIGAFVFFAVAILFRRKHLVLTARQVSILALVFVFPSILFGVLDWIHFYHAALIPAIRIKIILAAILIVLLSLGIVVGGGVKLRSAVMAVIYICSFVTVVGLGYFGASLIFGRGAALGSSSQAAVSGAASSGAAAAQVPAGFKAGKALFEANCQACHPGGANSIVATLPIRGSKRLASLDQFERFLRAPTMPDGKGGEMPPYGTDVLASGQVKDLHSFLVYEFK